MKSGLWNRDYLESQAVSVCAPSQRAPLGVCVDQENILVQLGQLATKVNGDSGLADAAFLVGYGDDFTHIPRNIDRGGRPKSSYTVIILYL